MTETQRAAMQQALGAVKKLNSALAEQRAALDYLLLNHNQGELIARLKSSIADVRLQTLDALKSGGASLNSLRAALAEPETIESTDPIWQTIAKIGESAPAGTWDAAVDALQPLTTDQIVKLWNESIANGAVLGLSDTVLFARAVEHAHGIKEAK